MYEQTFGTDWETIDDRDEVVRRAYALGVATRLGAGVPGELERLAAQTDLRYDRSFVELAYQKGRDEAAASSIDDPEELWEELVEEKTEITPPDRDDDAEWEDPTDETGLPDALGLINIDTLPDDSTDRVRRPSFLERDGDSRPVRRSEERTVFGRPISDVRGGRRERDDRDARDRGDDDSNPEPADESGGTEPNRGSSTDESADRSRDGSTSTGESAADSASDSESTERASDGEQ